MGGEKQNEDGYPKYLPLEDGKVLYRPPFSYSDVTEDLVMLSETNLFKDHCGMT